ncbi:haloalkane dehalogenase [Pelomonas sp. SE-A7]|uniref:haloalkane dehalogenase n=1 Tax=Pelomonas sp. SE-A7 TaxID=3054953 RepID=UPI00259CE954|nr:haloalkane dehalogenase [Pelomonas sp. SE-A7]MDM4765044.1 haloalkane dehalogenase [Pelomonas sp. SE-A7]
MELLRTPDERFADLPDYPFQANYLPLESGPRVHYVDEGPRDGKPVLMLHGEPTWSYLYRHMIPPVAAAGLRVLAPDLVGFGKSDKPLRREAHSYEGQVAWMREWLEALDLRGVTLVCQDWGSLIGLRLLAECPERFDRVLLGNGGLPTHELKIGWAFPLWRAFSRWSPWFPIGWIVQGGTRRRLSRAERAAYDAPFPDAAHAVAARVYPSLVPVLGFNPRGSDDNGRAWRVLEQWHKPFICCYSDGDPITRGLDREFRRRVPGAAGQPHCTLRGGHFLQEDDAVRFAQLIIATCKPPSCQGLE